MTTKPGFLEMMKMAKKVQDQVRIAQKELEDKRITGESGGGLVKLTINGKHDPKSVIIDDNAMNEGKEVLQDLIAAAINDANRKLEVISKEHLSHISKDLGVPSDFEGFADEED